MDENLLGRILMDIKEEYPKEDSRVSPKYASVIIQKILEQYYAIVPKNMLIILRNELLSLEKKSLKGITAREFFESTLSIINRIGLPNMSRESDKNLIRLERQINDLRSIVTSPNTVERRIADLQDQIEDLKEDRERVASAEKQEDMLQKFLQSEKKAFIIMPFSRDFDNVWVGAIKSACMDTHYAPLRADEINLSSLITDDIEKYTLQSDVVIVDLTGNNPNVMFELGWSLAKNKKPIVICQGDHANKVAFDVRSIRFIPYENSWLGIEALKKKLKEFITTTEKHTKEQPKKKAVKKKTINTA